MNIIKGPGLREITFWKPPESEIEDYNPSNEQDLRRDYTFEDNTKLYSCFSFLQDQISKKDEDGCEYKNQEIYLMALLMLLFLVGPISMI